MPFWKINNYSFTQVCADHQSPQSKSPGYDRISGQAVTATATHRKAWEVRNNAGRWKRAFREVLARRQWKAPSLIRLQLSPSLQLLQHLSKLLQLLHTEGSQHDHECAAHTRSFSWCFWTQRLMDSAPRDCDSVVLIWRCQIYILTALPDEAVRLKK